MRVNTNIHLNREDGVQSVSNINNFGTLQLSVTFKSGQTILIDEAILNDLDKYRMSAKPVGI